MTSSPTTTKWRPINTMPRDRMVLVSDGDIVKPGTRVAEDVIAAPILTTIKLWTHWREFPEPPK